MTETLGLAQRFGFLGAAPIAEVIAHARRFVDALPASCRRVIDVGAGGGTPGLVIAVDRPDLELVLLDRRATRCDFLERAVRRLGVGDRVTVETGDAAHFARLPAWKESFDAAVARGLGAPAVTAELCRGFVADGGVLVVSEPPAERRDGADSRWPAEPLLRLGWSVDDDVFPGVARLRAVGPVPQGVPRTGRIPASWS